jgi:hypothetical protein
LSGTLPILLFGEFAGEWETNAAESFGPAGRYRVAPVPSDVTSPVGPGVTRTMFIDPAFTRIGAVDTGFLAEFLSRISDSMLNRPQQLVWK